MSKNIQKQFYLNKEGLVMCKCGLKAIDLRDDKKYVCSGITIPHGCKYSNKTIKNYENNKIQ